MAKIALPDMLAMVDDEAEKMGVDRDVAKGILLAENFGDQSVGKVVANPGNYSIDTGRVSPKGARGVMQVMPATYDALKTQGFLPSDHALTDDPRTHIQAGLATIKEITKRLKSSDPYEIAADYNAGPRGSKAYRESGKLPAETEGYLNKVALATTGYQANDPNFQPSGSQSEVRAVDNAAVVADTPNANGMLPHATTGGSFRTAKTVQNYEAAAKALEDNGIYVNQLIDQITRGREEEAIAFNQMGKDFDAAGRAAAQAAAAKGTVEGAAAITRERILGLLDLNTTVSDNAVARNISSYLDMDNQRMALAKDIDARMSVGVFDNPVQWLVNQTILPGKVNAHNAIAREQDNLIHKTEVLQKIAGNQEQIDVAASADDIGKMYTSMGAQQAAEANAHASSARAQAAGASARAATTIAGLVDTRSRLTLELSRMRTLIDSERAGGRSQKDLDEEAEFEKGLKRIGTIMGAPDISLAALKRMTKPDQDMWATRVAKNSIGDNLFEALTFFDKFGNVNTMKASGSAELSQLMTAMKKQVADRANELGILATTQGGKAPNRAELLQNASNSLEMEFFASRQNMLAAKSYNPYLINHKVMATSFKDNPDNPVFKMVRQTAASNINVSDQQLFSAVVTAVEGGKLSPKDAAQAMTEYYSAGITRNNTARSPNLIGLETQDDYKILPKEARRTINLLNPGEIENLLVNRLASRRSAGGVPGFLYQEMQNAEASTAEE